MINVIIVNFSDSRGGAAIAARNQVFLVKNSRKFNVNFVVAEKLIDDNFSFGPSKMQYTWHFFLRVISHFLSKFKTGKYVKQSLNIFSSSFVKRKLRSLKSDIYHFHWINNDALSIEFIVAFLKKNSQAMIVFTLHDEWMFCGAEHYHDFYSDKYIKGYNDHDKFFDLDRWVYKRKLKFKSELENKNVVITVPSTYLLEKAKSSYLLAKTKIELIPNTIDTITFSPKAKLKSEIFQIRDDSLVVLFGAMGGLSDLKGQDLLYEALGYLSENIQNKNICLIEFGGNDISREKLFKFELIRLGRISNRELLSDIYSAADLTVVPSRIEAFGQVAAESLACATPVVAFDNSGILDIVTHEVSGLLIPAFDAIALAKGIEYLLSLPSEKRKQMGIKGREHIVNLFSADVVSKQWENLYNSVIIK